ncbi:MAG: phosphoadenylyl-sulfate reductase [Pirellulales bacterium]
MSATMTLSRPNPKPAKTTPQEVIMPMSASVEVTQANRAACPALSVSPSGPCSGMAKWTPTTEELEQLRQESLRLETATPREIIAWAVETYFPKLTMATAFGPEGCVILRYLAEIEPRTYVFNLDTGYQFQETLEVRDRIARRYGIEVELRRPAQSVEEYESLHGGPLYRSNPDQCCRERKVTVLHEAVAGMRAWMSGIRRDQSPDRAKAPIVGWDKKFGLVKISPLANWTKKDIWGIINHEDIPYNSLHDQGYTSIGCRPCTRPVMFGEDERAGRWSGFAKTECGLHTDDKG